MQSFLFVNRQLAQDLSQSFVEHIPLHSLKYILLYK